MRYNIKSLVISISFLMLFTKMYAYNWPFVNGQIPYQINSTFGECREERDHFHNGVDIQTTTNTEILAIDYSGQCIQQFWSILYNPKRD